MKFILANNGFEAINTDYVKKILVDRIVYRNGRSEERVIAELDDGTEFILKVFDSGNMEEDSRASEKYLADLLAKLNGGKL